MPEAERVVAVVVTWNRRDLLAESLRAVQAQTRRPDVVVVVDNASDDGTADLLATGFSDVEVVRAARNTGGAGGFAIGIDRALALDADAIWLMDDDTVPRASALDTLLRARHQAGLPPPAVMASRVVWVDGRDHPMNTPRRKLGARAPERRAAGRLDCLPIRSASFVSTLVDADTVRARGLPVANYFLWNDDFEFTTRLTRGGRGLYCPASVVVHKTATFGAADADPGERFFFEVRNKVWLFGRSKGLSPAEKALYAGSTARRWLRTIARSSDRAVLYRGLRSGLAAGLRSRPRPTEEIIADATGADRPHG